jgi:hypothetical protein
MITQEFSNFSAFCQNGFSAADGFFQVKKHRDMRGVAVRVSPRGGEPGSSESADRRGS